MSSESKTIKLAVLPKRFLAHFWLPVASSVLPVLDLDFLVNAAGMRMLNWEDMSVAALSSESNFCGYRKAFGNVALQLDSARNMEGTAHHAENMH